MIKVVKKWYFFNILLAFLICFMVGCSSNNNVTETPKEDISFNYLIDVDSMTYNDGEVGELYVIDLPQLIDRSGSVVKKYTVKIDSVTNEDGKRYMVAARRFTPDKIGKYKISFTCGKNDVKDSFVVINVKDSFGPEIEILTVKEFIFVNEECDLPTFEALDSSGIDDEKTFVKVFDDKNKEVLCKNGKFTVNQQGNYKYCFVATDKLGQETKKEIPFVVADCDRRDGGVTYWDENAYNTPIVKYANASLPTISWDNNVKDPDGNSTLKVKTVANERYCAFAMSCAINDWSAYDYVGFWVHNPTDKFLVAGFIRIADEDTFVLSPNSWTYITLGAKTNDYVNANIVADKFTQRHQIVLAIYDRYLDRSNHEIGIEFHVSNVTLYKYDENSDIVFGFGEKQCFHHFGVNEVYMEEDVRIVTDNKLSEDNYSAKITKYSKSPKEGNVAGINIWYKHPNKKNFDSDNRFYTMSVYNPNDYDVIIIDNDAWGTMSDGENYSTIIKAKQRKDVLLNVRDNYVNYFSCYKYDESKQNEKRIESIEMGSSIYVSSIRMGDNVTDQSLIDSWNDKNGDPIIAEYFG